VVEHDLWVHVYAALVECIGVGQAQRMHSGAMTLSSTTEAALPPISPRVARRSQNYGLKAVGVEFFWDKYWAHQNRFSV